MTKTDKHLSEGILEIIKTEQKRAKKLMEDSVFNNWVEDFRKNYIVNGFLIPFYAHDGRYSRSKQRISKFSNYIMPWKKQGEVFYDLPQGRIRSEDMWFWSYLIDGQEIISSRISIPEVCKIDGIPASLVWQEIVAVTKELHLYGEASGGIWSLYRTRFFILQSCGQK